MASNIAGSEKMLEEIKREDIAKLGEAVNRIVDVLREILEELKAHRKILQDHEEILQRHTKILEEHTRILESHSKMLMELKILVGSLGKRVGRDLEKTVLALYRDDLAQIGIDPEKARRFIYTDLEGKLGVKGARYEFDVIIEDEGAAVIEVKSRAEREDIDWLYEKVKRAEQLMGRVKRIVIVAVNIDREALERAEELGIDAIYGSIETDTSHLSELLIITNSDLHRDHLGLVDAF